MSYDNTNTGALFVNKNKKEDKHPAWKGKVNINGQEWEISGWDKITKTNESMISLRISEPYKNEAPAPITTTTKTTPF